LVHESSKGGESTVHDKFDIAQLTRAELQFFGGLGNCGSLLLIGFEDEVDKASSVGSLLGGIQLKELLLTTLRERVLAAGALVKAVAVAARERMARESFMVEWLK